MATSAADIKWLTELKAEIEQAKIDKAGIDGAIAQNMKRLKDEFNCGSIDRAKAKLQQLRGKKDELDGKIEEAIAALKERYA